MISDYKSTSFYEQLMMNEIDFNEFYHLAKIENKQAKSHFFQEQPTLFASY